MKDLLIQLLGNQPLSVEQTEEAFETIMTGGASPAQLGAFLALIQSRGATVQEITGAALVMRRKLTPVEVPPGLRIVDTCGTGGDYASTFNISTAAAIVAAAAGRSAHMAVAKHGNRAVTSQSGSSQVFDVLGVNLDVQPSTLSRCLEEAGLCFCFAPSHHPAMKHAIAVRRELGFPTIFNVLGPLTNPAGARHQVLGVFSPDLTEPIAHVLKELGTQRAMVVCGRCADGVLDELTTTGSTQITQLDGDRITTMQLDVTTLGLALTDPHELQADSPQTSAEVIRGLLAGRRGAPRDIVCLNAAAALFVADLAEDLATGIQLAADAIDGGTAATVLQMLVEITQADAT